MTWLWLLLVVLVLCFCFVVFFGAPYLPTLSKQTQTALDLLDLKPGQTLLELGCGDGRVLVAAAQRGLHVVGYELNPLLALYAWLRTRRYGRKVRVVCADFWRRKWPPTDGIFVFLLDKYMPRLNTKIIQTGDRPLKLASFAFQVPGKQAVATKDGVFLYEYR